MAGVSIPDCASSVVSQYTPFDVGAMSWASPVTVAMVRCGHWLENTFVTVAGGCGGDVVGVGNGRAAVVGGAVDRVTGRISVADFAPPQAETRSAACQDGRRHHHTQRGSPEGANTHVVGYPKHFAGGVMTTSLLSLNA